VEIASKQSITLSRFPLFSHADRPNSAKLIVLKATSVAHRSPIHHAVALRAIRKEKGFLWWIICSRACRLLEFLGAARRIIYSRCVNNQETNVFAPASVTKVRNSLAIPADQSSFG